MDLAFFLLLLGLVVAAIADFYTGKIPNWLTLPLIPIGVVTNGMIAVWGLSLMVVFLALWSIASKVVAARLGKEEGFGMGDTKLILAMASAVPFYGVMGYTFPFLVLWLSLIVHLPLISVYKGYRSPPPFAPSMLAGFVLAVLFNHFI